MLDCIDNIDTKVDLLAECTRRGLRVLASAARRPGNGYTALHFAAIADAADLIKRAGRFDEFRKSIDVLSSEAVSYTHLTLPTILLV